MKLEELNKKNSASPYLNDSSNNLQTSQKVEEEVVTSIDLEKQLILPGSKREFTKLRKLQEQRFI